MEIVENYLFNEKMQILDAIQSSQWHQCLLNVLVRAIGRIGSPFLETFLK